MYTRRSHINPHKLYPRIGEQVIAFRDVNGNVIVYLNKSEGIYIQDSIKNRVYPGDKFEVDARSFFKFYVGDWDLVELKFSDLRKDAARSPIDDWVYYQPYVCRNVKNPNLVVLFFDSATGIVLESDDPKYKKLEVYTFRNPHAEHFVLEETTASKSPPKWEYIEYEIYYT